MKNNQKGFVIPIIIAVVALFAVGGGAYIYTNNKVEAPVNILDITSNVPTTTSRNIVGGDKDAHGCIASAGYTWCVVKNKCLRTWEEKCEISSVSDATLMCKSDDDCKEISFPTAGGSFHEKCLSGKCIIPEDVIQRGQVGNIPPGIACTMDAKQCADGSYVGRTGPNCQFVCPASDIDVPPPLGKSTLQISCNSQSCNTSGVNSTRSNFYLTNNGKQVKISPNGLLV